MDHNDLFVPDICCTQEEFDEYVRLIQDLGYAQTSDE